jgi:hypothetical protein
MPRDRMIFRAIQRSALAFGARALFAEPAAGTRVSSKVE